MANMDRILSNFKNNFEELAHEIIVQSRHFLKVKEF